ncbi:MAG: HAD family hydrolase [Clostridia bacterium]|nr:HAD family hydrolase [Clostridia bacterium]
MKKLAIFDLDGTLFDTTLAMQLCGNYALEKLGLPTFPAKAYAGFSGGGIEGYVFAILDAAGDVEHKHFHKFWELYCEKNLEVGTAPNVPFDGIVPMLEKLKEMGVILAVLSNKDHESCVRIVEEIFGEGMFDVIRGNGEDLPPKPHPAGMEAVLRETGFSREEALYVGDTEVDMETGKNAGVFTIAVLWGYRSEEVLAAYSPEAIITSPEDILKLIP